MRNSLRMGLAEGEERPKFLTTSPIIQYPDFNQFLLNLLNLFYNAPKS